MKPSEVLEMTRELIQQGFSPQDAKEIVQNFLAQASISGKNESPEDAKRRWIEQEKSDPNGVYGSAISGGVFGSGPIALEDYDPSARAFQNSEMVSQMQAMNLHLLQTLISERADRRTIQEPALPKPLSTFSRLLGRKK